MSMIGKNVESLIDILKRVEVAAPSWTCSDSSSVLAAEITVVMATSGSPGC